MHDSADRLDFAPPPQPAAARAFALAILAHLLLMLALTWGVNWNHESQDLAAEAELWSSVPQQAAPQVVQAPPLQAPRPEPVAPKVEPRPAPPPPVNKAPDIAHEREKQRREAERREEELERQKKLAERKKQEELKRQEIAEQKAAEEEKKKEAEELARKLKQEEAKLAALRKENLERMMRDATGPPSSTGTAVRSSGPSASWAGKIQAAVYPNIVFRETVSTPLRVQVEIRMSPDGTIVGKPLIRKSSGNPAWDEAVLRGLDKTGVLPRDVGGKVYSPALIGFSHGSS